MKPTTDSASPKDRSRLWLVFVAVCALQMAAWTAWFILASHHRVEEVPLTTVPHR